MCSCKIYILNIGYEHDLPHRYIYAHSTDIKKLLASIQLYIYTQHLHCISRMGENPVSTTDPSGPASKHYKSNMKNKGCMQGATRLISMMLYAILDAAVDL